MKPISFIVSITLVLVNVIINKNNNVFWRCADIKR